MLCTKGKKTFVSSHKTCLGQKHVLFDVFNLPGMSFFIHNDILCNPESRWFGEGAIKFEVLKQRLLRNVIIYGDSHSRVWACVIHPEEGRRCHECVYSFQKDIVLFTRCCQSPPPTTPSFFYARDDLVLYSFRNLRTSSLVNSNALGR